MLCCAQYILLQVIENVHNIYILQIIENTTSVALEMFKYSIDIYTWLFGWHRIDLIQIVFSSDVWKMLAQN